jgi:C4-type Zn-finger protein
MVKKEMVKCPFCKKEIKTLVHLQNGNIYYIMRLDENGDPIYEQDEISVWEAGEWLCPVCEKTLFYNEEDAVNFLKGNKKEVK